MKPADTRSWELKLSPIHIVVLMGLTTGSIAGAFYLGLQSGQAIGFDTALKAAIANSARMTIPESELEPEAGQEASADLYARLTKPDESRKEMGLAKREETLPPLKAIESAGEPSPERDSNVSVPSETLGAGSETLGAIEENAAAKVNSLGSAETIANGSTDNPAAKKVFERTEAAATESKEAVVSAGAAHQAAAEKVAKVEAVVVPTATPVPPKPTATPKPVEHVAQTTAKVTEKAPTTKSVVPEKESVKEVVPPGWYIQIAAPRQLPEAQELARKLRSAAIPVLIEGARVRGDEYFRVIVGPVKERADADKMLAKVKNQSFVRGDPFIRAVK